MLNETIAVYLQDIRKGIMTVSPYLNAKKTYPHVRGLAILELLPTLYTHTELFAFLPSATKLRQDNIFTGVCQSFGEGVVSGRHPPWADPLVQTPPQETPPGQTPPRQTPPRQTPPGQTPPGRHPSGKVHAGIRILLECILVLFLHHVVLVNVKSGVSGE